MNKGTESKEAAPIGDFSKEGFAENINEEKDQETNTAKTVDVDALTKKLLEIRGSEEEGSSFFTKEEAERIAKNKTLNRSIALEKIPETIPERIENGALIFGIDLEEWKKIIVQDPGLLTCNPETLKQNAEEIATLLEEDSEIFLEKMLKNPTTLSNTAQGLEIKIEEISRHLNINHEKAKGLFKKEASLISYSSEALIKKIEELSIITKKDTYSIVDSVFSSPSVLTLKTANIKEKISHLAEALKMEEEDIVASLTNRSLQALNYKTETIVRRVEGLANFFEVDTAIIIKMTKHYPSAIFQETEKIEKNVIEISNATGVSLQEIKKAIMRTPSIMRMRPEEIKRKVEETSEKLGVESSLYIKAALRSPSLLYTNSEKIIETLEKSSIVLGLEKKEFIDMALKQPPLFYTKPKTIEGNFAIISTFIFNGNKEEAKKTIQKMPSMLNLSEERTYLSHVASQITGKKPNLIKNPIKELVSAYEAGEIQDMDQKSFDTLLNALMSFEKIAKEIRKNRPKNENPE